jgi:pilus assembly protein FimV
VPVFAYAMGLGKLVVRSGLDEPLNGEIELVSPTPQELRTLKATLASRADFESAGIDRPFFLTNIKFELSQRADGASVVKLTTDEPVREPFLHLLMQVEWSGGRLIREYTALLDPPQWAVGAPTEIQAPEVPAATAAAPTEAPAEPAGAAASAVPASEAPAAPVAAAPAAEEPAVTETAPPAPASETVTAAPAAPTEPAPAATEPAREPAVASAPAGETGGAVRAWASAWEYGPVKRGETLGNITSKLRTDKSLSTQQVMLALLRTNPAAFYENNVNNLKTGVILKVPEKDVVVAVSRAQAAKEFQAQYDAWQKYKVRLAGASQVVTIPSEAIETPAAAPVTPPAPKAAAPVVAEKPPAPAPKAAEAAPKPEVATKPAAKTAPPATVETDEELLKIVRSNLDQPAPAEAVKAPGVETSKDAAREQRALKERLAPLEEAIESKELQNKEMRERAGKEQEQIKNTSRLLDLENKDLAQAQKQAAAGTKPAGPAPLQTAPMATEQVGVSPTPAKGAESEPAQVAQATPPPAKPAARRPVVRPAPPKEEPGFVQSFMDNIMDNPLMLTMLGGVGVLAAGIGGIYFMRRRRASAEFEESILSGASVTSDAASMSNTAGQAGASDTSFLSDFSQGGMGNIHTDEVDPIAEAEVYLAYGRDEQAEDILKEAVVKDPARHELKQKLLEIYHQRNDVGAFETLAEELYAALEGKGGKVWEKVEEMGRKISPNNPMFRGGAPRSAVGAAAAVSAAPAIDTPEFSPSASPAPAERAQAAPLPADEPMLSLDATPDLDFRHSASAPAMDFDLNLDTAAAPTDAKPAPGKTGMTLDFDIQDTPAAAPATSARDGGLDFGDASSGVSDHDIALDFDEARVAPGTHDDALSFSLDGAAPDNPTLEFDTGGDEVAMAVDEPQWDETATKLDLAKAYIDMGDADGARSILDEVLAEGNEAQKTQARDLAAQIKG